MQCASVRITNAPKRRPSSTATSLIKFKSPKNNNPRSCPVWTLTFLLGAEQTNQTNPKFPAPALHADRLLHSTATKTCFFEPKTTTRHRPRAYHEICPTLRLVACVSSDVESFSSIQECAPGPGPAADVWCVEGGGDGVRCGPLATFAPVFSEKWGPRVLPLVAPRPPLREWEVWRGE